MWNRDAIEAISYYPWNPKKTEVAPQPLRLEDREPAASGSAIPPIISPPVPNARRLYITHNDIQKHGFTPGCPGCSAIRDKRKPVGHSPACRKRVEEAMASSEQGKRRMEEVENRKRRCQLNFDFTKCDILELNI